MKIGAYKGEHVIRIDKGSCQVFYTHGGPLGTYQGLQVLSIIIERLRRFYGDKIEWMAGLETCRRFAE